MIAYVTTTENWRGVALRGFTRPPANKPTKHGLALARQVMHKIGTKLFHQIRSNEINADSMVNGKDKETMAFVYDLMGGDKIRWPKDPYKRAEIILKHLDVYGGGLDEL